MEDVDALIQELLENFGTAEEEEITENSYKVKNRNEQMKSDIQFLETRVNKSTRMNFMGKTGFDI